MSTSAAYRAQRDRKARRRRCISRQAQMTNTRTSTAGSTAMKASVTPTYTALGTAQMPQTTPSTGAAYTTVKQWQS